MTLLTLLLGILAHSFLHWFHHGRGSQFIWSVWVTKHGALCYGHMTLVSRWGLTVVVCSNFYCAAMFLERRVVLPFGNTSMFICCCWVFYFWKFLQECCSLNFLKSPPLRRFTSLWEDLIYSLSHCKTMDFKLLAKGHITFPRLIGRSDADLFPPWHWGNTNNWIQTTRTSALTDLVDNKTTRSMCSFKYIMTECNMSCVLFTWGCI